MGERLGIGIIINGNLQAASYHHWSESTEDSYNLLEKVMNYINNNENKDDLLFSIHALENTGAGLEGASEAVIKKAYKNEEFNKSSDRETGYIYAGLDAKQVIKMTNKFILINMDKKEINFGPINYFKVKDNFVPDEDNEEVNAYLKKELENHKFTSLDIDIDPERIKFDQLDKLHEIVTMKNSKKYFIIKKVTDKVFYLC